ncbi:unnamed protein product, partial [Amoebophrya sp. A25]
SSLCRLRVYDADLFQYAINRALATPATTTELGALEAVANYVAHSSEFLHTRTTSCGSSPSASQPEVGGEPQKTTATTAAATSIQQILNE